MKLTKSKLKLIIKEEIQLLKEETENDIIAYYNGKTYLVILNNGDTYEMGMHPLQPNGINMYAGEVGKDVILGKHLGKKINYKSLPKEIKQAIKKRQLDENNIKILKEETIEDKITDLYKDIIDSFNINRHINDFKTGTTLEFKVKNPEYPKYNEVKKYFKDEDEYNEFLQFQFEIGDMVNEYGSIIFNRAKKILKTLKPNDWSYAGRSNGWYVILFDDDLEYLVQDYIEGDDDEVEENYKELEKIYDEFLQVENLVLNAKRKFKSYVISYIKKLKS